MTETNEYDAIFAALKHPVRRQILLFLEQKGEASFTDIQNAVGINETGLMSYHLKELTPLIEQSSRGKYRLSEVGQTSIVLLRKVEKERQMSSSVVRRELEKWIEEAVFLFFIVGLSLMAPLSVDIYISVQNLMYTQSLSFGYVAGMYLISLSGMVIGAVMFAFYDRHYFSKNIKTNIIHSTIFAISISLISIFSAYMIHKFEASMFEVSASSNSGGTWPFSILCAVSFLASTPLITYGLCKLAKRY